MFIQAIASSNFVVSLRLYLSHLLLGGYFLSVYPEIVAGFLASVFSLSVNAKRHRSLSHVFVGISSPCSYWDSCIRDRLGRETRL